MRIVPRLRLRGARVRSVGAVAVALSIVGAVMLAGAAAAIVPRQVPRRSASVEPLKRST